MNIVLFGYGKMGKLCEELAEARGHVIVGIVTSTTNRQIIDSMVSQADMLIDFSRPESAVDHILLAIRHKKNIVEGTTGWYDRLPEIAPKVVSAEIGCLYSPNFSLGVALFNDLLALAASLLKQDLGYETAILDIHHSKKLDSPSGTAKMIASTVERQRKTGPVSISSLRVGNISGTHSVLFDSLNDTITLTHEARNRIGFAEGAVIAAEWLNRKVGLFSFDDFFQDLKTHLTQNN